VNDQHAESPGSLGPSHFEPFAYSPHTPMRCFLYIVAIPTVLIGVSASALWVRSYWYFDTLHSRRNNAEFRVEAARGELFVTRWRYASSFPKLKPGWTFQTDSPSNATGQSPERGFAGIRSVLRGPVEPVGRVKVSGIYVAFPIWPVSTLCLVPVVQYFVFRARRKWIQGRRGLCPSCGYDLRATPRPGNCPECGKETPPVAEGTTPAASM
jgi:hypothetical protein